MLWEGDKTRSKTQSPYPFPSLKWGRAYSTPLYPLPINPPPAARPGFHLATMYGGTLASYIEEEEEGGERERENQIPSLCVASSAHDVSSIMARWTLCPGGRPAGPFFRCFNPTSHFHLKLEEEEEEEHGR